MSLTKISGNMLSLVAADIPNLDASKITTGTLAISRLGASGTPSSTTYLRGDNTWATITGGSGTVTSVAALTLGTTGTDISSTVATGTTTPVITLNIPTASATNRGALSSTDWTTFNNKGSVTSVAAITVGTTGTDISSSVANSTTTPVITLNIPTASATNRGALSAADWTTFNNKTSNTGTVTSIVAGTGLSGGTITTSGTISLANTAVTAGSYTSANITVDAQGRITSASNGSGGGGSTLLGISTATNTQTSNYQGNSGVGYGYILDSNNTYQNTFLGSEIYIESNAPKNVLIGQGANIRYNAGYSVVIGQNASARSGSWQSVLVGYNAYVGDNQTSATVIGANAAAYVGSSVTVGAESRNYGGSVIVGVNSRSDAQGSVLLGLGANDGGYSAIVINGNNGYNTFTAPSAGLFITGITQESASNVLYYNSTTKKITYSAASGGSINSLQGVQISNPTNGQLLQYNGTNWINATVSTGSTGGSTGTMVTLVTTTPYAPTQISQSSSTMIISFSKQSDQDAVYNIINTLKNYGADSVIANTSNTSGQLPLNPNGTVTAQSWYTPYDVVLQNMGNYPYIQGLSGATPMVSIMMTGNYNNYIGNTPIVSITTTPTTIAIQFPTTQAAQQIGGLFRVAPTPASLPAGTMSFHTGTGNQKLVTSSNITGVAVQGTTLTFTVKSGSITESGGGPPYAMWYVSFGTTVIQEVPESSLVTITTTTRLQPTGFNTNYGYLLVNFSSAGDANTFKNFVQALCAAGYANMYMSNANSGTYYQVTYGQYDTPYVEGSASVHMAGSTPSQYYGAQTTLLRGWTYSGSFQYISSAISSITVNQDRTEVSITAYNTVATKLVETFTSSYLPYSLDYHDVNTNTIWSIAGNAITGVSSTGNTIKFTVKANKTTNTNQNPPGYLYLSFTLGVTTSTLGLPVVLPTVFKKGMYFRTYDMYMNELFSGWIASSPQSIDSSFGGDTSMTGQTSTFYFSGDMTRPFTGGSNVSVRYIDVWITGVTGTTPTGDYDFRLNNSMHNGGWGSWYANTYNNVMYFNLNSSGFSTVAGVLSGMTSFPYSITQTNT